MQVKTSDKKIYTGAVRLEVLADTAVQAENIARAIAGITLHNDFKPVRLDDGAWLLSGEADNVSDAPAGVTVWLKSPHQLHN
jgi:hypothetical protein